MEINWISTIISGCLILSAYFLGKLDGRNQGVANILENLIGAGFLKYREKSNGDLEFVQHPEK